MKNTMKKMTQAAAAAAIALVMAAGSATASEPRRIAVRDDGQVAPRLTLTRPGRSVDSTPRDIVMQSLGNDIQQRDDAVTLPLPSVLGARDVWNTFQVRRVPGERGDGLCVGPIVQVVIEVVFPGSLPRCN